jgi:tight adherence protein C
MSNLWLAFALIGTFLTIFLLGVILDMLMREKNRPVSILESQIGGTVTDSVDLRQQELEGSAMDRMLLPSAKKLGRGIMRLTPFDLYGRIEADLVLAGNPAGWDAERVVALKIIGGIAGAILGALLATLVDWKFWMEAVVVVIVALIGYTMPGAQLASMARSRQRSIQRQLPDVMDLLTISVEAGLGFDAAMAQVTRNVPGALSEEFSRLLQEVQIGVSRGDAFRHLGDRTDVPELQSFVLSMIQADLFGVSIANVLRAQSRELRQKRRQRAEEIAQKIPIKLLFPMIFLVLPSLFIVVIGPGAIKIYHQLLGR